MGLGCLGGVLGGRREGGVVVVVGYFLVCLWFFSGGVIYLLGFCLVGFKNNPATIANHFSYCAINF